jgi:2-polyprenyl-6-methoxyphenol hydroxylase-like FAD-dependent oxidoreductase
MSRWKQPSVIVVGAGPVGLALALELGNRRISCVVVEMRNRGRLVPRAKLANVRTMEHMRRWGIAEDVRRASPLSAEYSTDISFVTAVLGQEITRFTNVCFTGRQRDDRFAEAAQQIPQYVLEPVLRDAANALPSVEFCDGWRLDSVAERDSETLATIVNEAGDTRVIAAQYMVGCDGAGSTVRERLGLALVGERALAQNLGIVFRAPDLAGRIRVPPALQFWTVNAATPSYMGPADRHGLWWLQATAVDPAVAIDDLDPVKVVWGALGEEVPIEIVNVDPWRTHALTANKVRKGRVFLAGDAAHLHSPMGAHGMNQGVGDAVDLGWKLAAVLDGWASESLLDTYELERAPLHARVTSEATHNYSLVANHFVRPGLDAATPEGEVLRRTLAAEIQHHKRREFFSLGLVLGHVYERSPVIVADAYSALKPSSDVDSLNRALLSGARAPHAWRDDGTSLFDHFGPHLTLLAFGQSSAPSLERAAADLRVPLRVVTVTEPEIQELYGARFALIRPDQVVCWHGDYLPDPVALLETVTARRQTSSLASAQETHEL